jgi:hypothetical protein
LEASDRILLGDWVNRGIPPLLEDVSGFGSWHHQPHNPYFEKEAGTGRAVPPYVEHQRYRKLLGQKVMAEAWQRLMQRTCRQAGELDTDLAGSELTQEILYALQEEAQENARRATSKLDEFLRAGQRYE